MSTSASSSPSRSDKILFWASFFTLIAAGIGFSVRGVSILKDWGNQFGFTQAELGTITGGGLIGFGLAIIFFSFFADRFGYGKLMVVAFLLHASSAVVTFAATPVYASYGKEGAFWCLNLGMWLFALGNGTCEAVINPLTATLFPKNKTHWLNILHAGWPLGLILGALVGLGFEHFGAGVRWEYKLGVFLVPVLIYGLMMVGRSFPKSEAKTAGIAMPEMMKTVGMLGFTLGAAFIGLALATLLPSVLGPVLKGTSLEISDSVLKWVGWGGAFVVWLIFALVTKFAIGSFVLAFLYLLHALVGYVELGTDSWITNITEQVLKSPTNALLAFIWTNVLMFTLRFFAGPIVHKINPVGLLFASACLGTLGLWMLGQNFTNSVWPWIGAVTIYGLGKTFYWPTLLGVISERFPKGGALALGLSGGIGMIGAGILGGPGIGYKQDYFAVEELKKTTEGQATYERYMARNDKDEPAKTGFPFVSDLFPNQAPPVAGIDNGKLKIFLDYGGILERIEADKAAGKEPPRILPPGLPALEAYVDELNAARKDGKPAPNVALTTLESDLVTLLTEKKANKPVEATLEKNLTAQKKWWDETGRPNYEQDKVPLVAARLSGAKEALLYTAVVPAALAVGFLLLILYFAATGGYKQVHIDDHQ
ncbi:MAG TPA: MFS transporter [Gemmata sp.]|nr:MFS transporter [Gemmata sp.]